MKILDWYILKRYLTTFIFTLLILIPIAVAIDVAEKIDKFLRHDDLTFWVLINDYYKNFVLYYANTFMPLALFLAVIIFTSRLANNTEVVAINSSQISFTRFLYPYFIGATIITTVALLMNHYVVPSSNKTRIKFEMQYVKNNKNPEGSVSDFSLQLNDSTYVFLQNFNLGSDRGYGFSAEVYDGLRLKRKLIADNIQWKEKDSSFKLIAWKNRIIFKNYDVIKKGTHLDTVFSFSPRDLNYKSALAQEIPSDELYDFIQLSTNRGVKNLNAYWVEFHKRTSLPVASYILTLIAVALSYKKRRGGMGVNLALGITLMFVYVFFLKVAEVLGGAANANPFLNVWMPNVVFGCLAIYLYRNARK